MNSEKERTNLRCKKHIQVTESTDIRSVKNFLVQIGKIIGTYNIKERFLKI